MAGMILAEERASNVGQETGPRDAAILSYEPGIVETEMQVFARSRSTEEFPWVGTFLDFQAQGRLVSPELPAAEMAAFLESERQPRFQERRLGS
jgi:NAD(P)-dependent dehydrogenase (short-subunit alcohol dehydrogenase family)